MFVTINGAVGFDAADFDGLYTSNGRQNGEPYWEYPQSPSDKNIIYDGSKWIINGLNTAANLRTSRDIHPSDIDTLWTYSDSGSTFDINIKCVLTSSPIAAPTSAPSQPPTTAPSYSPSIAPTNFPTFSPTRSPSLAPSKFSDIRSYDRSNH